MPACRNCILLFIGLLINCSGGFFAKEKEQSPTSSANRIVVVLFIIYTSYFILEKNNLIHSFKIKKIYPNSIEVQIRKADLLAITNFNEKKFFIGSNGKLIDYDSSNTNLPYVFGKVKTVDFINFVKIIEQSKFNFKGQYILASLSGHDKYVGNHLYLFKIVNKKKAIISEKIF